MRRHFVALAALCVALTFAGSASALDVGVTDDEGNVNPSFVFPTLDDLGMTTNVMSMRWDPLNPLGLPANFADIAAAVTAAQLRGVTVILATYQTANTGITDTPNGPAVFAQWLQQVAAGCPLCVRKVIVLNEPNLQFFFKPTFDSSCQPTSPSVYAQTLAAAYDALKAVSPSSQVYGIGLSPRGNDRCNAVSNVSMSPVKFLAALGKAYKAMGRTTPLMDAISFHPYPNVNTEGPTVGYRWPNIGIPNLDRLKQAFYDAFFGTAQPVIGVSSSAGAAIKIALDELGYQVDTQAHVGYAETENVPMITEETQAQWYADVIALYACDPSVESLNFFHLRDEADRRRFQSGLVRIDYSQRPSYDAVKNAIAQNQTCQGTPVNWRPATSVIGARLLSPRTMTVSKRQSIFRFQVTAEENATYEAKLTPKQGKGKGKALLTKSGDVRAYFKPFVELKGRKLPPGQYTFTVVLEAEDAEGRRFSATSTLTVK